MGCYCRFGVVCLFALALLVAPVAADPPAAKKPAASKKADIAAKKGDKQASKGEAAKKPEPAKKAEEAKKPAPATQKVKKGLLKITVEMEGVFEAENAREIVVRPEEWTGLVVLHAAPHGAYVRKGDVVLELDPEKLDHTITDVRNDLQITNLAFQETEEQLKAAEKTTPMDLEAGQRSAAGRGR